MLKIYHNPRCSKSRLGCQFLEGKGIEVEVIEYLKTPLSEVELKELLQKLNMEPEDLLRKGEDVYKDEIKGKNLSSNELISLMVQNPKLIERPIVVNGNKAVVARPAEKINEIL